MKNVNLLVALAGVLLICAPVSADTQSDLKDCRAALTEQGLFDAERHSLKFSHRKGNTRKRTMFLTLKDRDSASKQKVSCVLQRKDVIDLELTPRS